MGKNLLPTAYFSQDIDVYPTQRDAELSERHYQSPWRNNYAYGGEQVCLSLDACSLD